MTFIPSRQVTHLAPQLPTSPSSNDDVIMTSDHECDSTNSHPDDDVFHLRTNTGFDDNFAVPFSVYTDIVEDSTHDYDATMDPHELTPITWTTDAGDNTIGQPTVSHANNHHPQPMMTYAELNLARV